MDTKKRSDAGALKTRMVIALGGNALVKERASDFFAQQYSAIKHIAHALVPCYADPLREVVIVHGNGPQVGSEACKNVRFKENVPLYYTNAMTQGGLGFLIACALRNELKMMGITKEVVALITSVVVDMRKKVSPKPIGHSFRSLREARNKWGVRDEAYIRTLSGWRRTVDSPAPLHVCEEQVIGRLLDDGCIVVAGGGGGVPIHFYDKGEAPLDGIVDKDRTATLIASAIGAELLIILMQADHVYRNYGMSSADPFGRIQARDMRLHLATGCFAEGSMAPKIEAVCDFVESGAGRQAIITNVDALPQALCFAKGTIVYHVEKPAKKEQEGVL